MSTNKYEHSYQEPVKGHWLPVTQEPLEIQWNSTGNQ